MFSTLHSGLGGEAPHAWGVPVPVLPVLAADPCPPPPPLACLLQVGGKEFTPAGTIAMTKQADFEGGKLFPYLGGPYQGIDEAHLAFR